MAPRHLTKCSPKKIEPLGYKALVESENANDCGVRALEVCFNMAYEEAFSFLKSVGRLDSEGMEIGWLDRYAARQTPLNGFLLRRVILGRRLRVKRRQRLFTEGRWLIGTPGHIFAIKDGVIYDTIDHNEILESLVSEVWQVTPAAR
jgi:hypothetical protein